MKHAQTDAASHDSPAAAEQNLFAVENLSVAYDGKTVLEDINLTIKKSRITALLGPSGCGKTSLLRCLNRLTDLIPNCRVSGRIRFSTTDLLSPQLDVIALRRRVGFIFQKPNPFPMSIWRNMELPLREHGVRSRAKLEEVVETSLRDVGLWQEVKHRLRSSAQSLSGGQQQRLCMARALALSPEVLLMDEPCSALDPISTRVVEDLITRLRQRLTIVIVTHNLAQAERISDDAALFWMQHDKGFVVEQNTTHALFNTPTNPLTAAYVRGESG